MYGKPTEKVPLAFTELTTLVVPALAQVEIQPVKCVLHQRPPAEGHPAHAFLDCHDAWIAVAIGLSIDNRPSIAAVDETGEVLLDGPYLRLLKAIEVGYALLDLDGAPLPPIKICTSAGEELAPDEVPSQGGWTMPARELVGVPGATQWVRYHSEGFGAIVVTQNQQRPWLATIELVPSKARGALEVVEYTPPTGGNSPAGASSYKFQVPRGLFCCDTGASPRFDVSTVVTFNATKARSLLFPGSHVGDAAAQAAALGCSTAQPRVYLETSGSHARHLRQGFVLALPGDVAPREDLTAELVATAHRMDLGRRVSTALGNRWLDECPGPASTYRPPLEGKLFTLLRSRVEAFCHYELLALHELGQCPPTDWNCEARVNAAAAHLALRNWIKDELIAAFDRLGSGKLAEAKSTV